MWNADKKVIEIGNPIDTAADADAAVLIVVQIVGLVLVVGSPDDGRRSSSSSKRIGFRAILVIIISVGL